VGTPSARRGPRGWRDAMISTFDPLVDWRWRERVWQDPRASAFHTPEWLDALRRTYGFTPVGYAKGGEHLRSAIPFCVVTSWLTGRRLVSLPFSDHCEPLVDDPTSLGEILERVASEARRSGWRYVQTRPLIPCGGLSRFESEEPSYHYAIDLRPDLEALFKGIRYDNRKDIRRAERSQLRHVVGRDRTFVDAYFKLHVLTRSTQGVPPQPHAWFRNLAACLGEMLDIHLLLDGDVPIAGLVTILFRDKLMWKYSASHPVLDRAGMGKSLMWRSIASGKAHGASWLDMGRVEPTNAGLAQFKERFGALRSELVYLRYPPAPVDRRRPSWVGGVARSIGPHLPVTVLAAAGRVAYRHVA